MCGGWVGLGEGGANGVWERGERARVISKQLTRDRRGRGGGVGGGGGRCARGGRALPLPLLSRRDLAHLVVVVVVFGGGGGGGGGAALADAVLRGLRGTKLR
jgi:hypothetical protein